MTGENRPNSVAEPDLDWEVELRAGQQADGGAGSVEPELAIAKLLLHTRAPAELAMAREDAVWSEIERTITPVPWWRRPIVLWGGPLLAAASAVVLVVVLRQGEEHGSSRGAADMLEQQFAVLAPMARADLARSVDGERHRLRGELIATARAAGTTHGGAP